MCQIIRFLELLMFVRKLVVNVIYCEGVAGRPATRGRLEADRARAARTLLLKIEI